MRPSPRGARRSHPEPARGQRGQLAPSHPRAAAQPHPGAAATQIIHGSRQGRRRAPRGGRRDRRAPPSHGQSPGPARRSRCPSPGCRSPGAPRAPSSWEGRGGGARQPLAGVRSVKRRQNPQQHSPSSVPVCCPQGFKSTPWGSDRGDGAPQDPPLLGQGGHQHHCPVGKQRAPQPSFPAGYQARCLALLLPALCLSFPRPDPS